MFRTFKLYNLLFLAIGLLVSCTGDEGNYDYVDINEVHFEGFQEEYSVPRFDILNIAPDLRLTLDPNGSGKYAYSWEALQKGSVPGKQPIVLSTDKVLNDVIDLYPGNYTVYYTVKDLNSNVAFQTDFDLTVINSIYEGWLVLSEVNGGSRLDMVSLVEEEYGVLQDVLGLSSSQLTLEGKPGFVETYSYAPNYYGIYVSTSENGTTKIDPNTFEWNQGMHIAHEFTTNQPGNLELDNLVPKSSQTCFAVSEGNVYFYYAVWNLSYNAPINKVGGIPFNASPWIGKGFFAGNSILYDITNKRFVRASNGSCFEMPEGALFDYNTGKDLVYMISNDYNGGFGSHTFAFLKDPADGKLYLALIDANTANQVYYGEVTATDFDQAENYAISPDYGYIFYNVGSKVYQYDFSLGTTKLMLDKGNEQISYIKFHDFNGNSEEYNSMASQLIVCTYDSAGPEGENGSMEFYSVPPVNGQIQLETTYTGFGKIKSIAYRER